MSDHGQFVLTEKGPLAPYLQKVAGDALFNKDGVVRGVEVKNEAENRHGNFFLETWSNKAFGARGWLHTLETDVLFYQFLREQVAYAIPFRKLRRWALGCDRGGGNGGRFPEKLQTKYVQPNDTWGYCVPIPVVEREVGLRAYPFSALTEGGKIVRSPPIQGMLF